MTTICCEPRPGTSTANAEFGFDDADFERVRRLIHRRAGIALGEGKQAMVYSRLARRLRETGHASFAGYLHSLEGSTGDAAGAEWQAFVNALTTNLTAFFREEHHFDALADELALRADTRVRIWCSAASTGEEPYSIAMTCAEAATGCGTQAEIVASDIDTQVLATAARGVYAQGARGLSTERLRRHFLRGTGRNTGAVRVQPALVRQVAFRQHNLIGGSAPPGDAFDFVFCRNVMIYFDPPTQRKVLEHLHAALKPGGLLFAGHSENFADAKTLFRLRGKTIYERL